MAAIAEPKIIRNTLNLTANEGDSLEFASNTRNTNKLNLTRITIQYTVGIYQKIYPSTANSNSMVSRMEKRLSTVNMGKLIR
jgi:hypothetical protein